LNPTLPRPAGQAGVLIGAAALAVASAASAVVLGPAALALPAGALCVVLLVRHPPVLLAVFLHVGVFKGAAVFGSLPVDVTAALGLLLAAVCLHRLLEGRVRPVPVGVAAPLAVIGILAAIGLIWTPVPDYGTEKAAKFLTLTLLSATAAFFVIERRRDLRELLWAIVALAVLAAGLSVADPGSAEAGRLEFGGKENTIFTSRLICSGALVLFLGSGLLARRGWMRLALPLAALGLVAVAAGIGSRGPLLSLVLALACVFAVSLVRRPQQLLPALVIVAAAVAVFPFVSLPDTSRERLQRAVQNPSGSVEEDGRSALYTKAVEITEEHPLRGIGTGGFFLYSYVLSNQEEKYPHNIFLELSSELGIVPALLLGASVIVLLFTFYRRMWLAGEEEDRRLYQVFAGLFLFQLFAVQFSGDMNDNRTFWAMFGVAWLMARYGIPRDAPAATDAPERPRTLSSGRR
jgi:O-antigen ligase